MDGKSILNKEFPECANEALLIIKSNYKRLGRQELTHLAYQYIFFNDYNQEQNLWIKKTNCMQDLQCVDSIVKFLETEKEAQTRDFVFDLLFGDIYHQLASKSILQLLISYSMSLEANKTLECASKWIITNIGNEIIQTIFDQLVKEHFLLIYIPESKEIQKNLINLCETAPLFSSLFMSIILDMLANDLIQNQNKFLKKMTQLFEIWIEKNPMLPLLAYKSNLSHLLNPLPGLIYITVLYPIKTFIECSKLCDKQIKTEDMVFKIHLISLKLIKNLYNSLNQNESIKLLNIKNFESISKKLEDYLSQIRNLNLINLEFKKVFDECLERLAQLIEICLQYSFISCNKLEIKSLFKKLIENNYSGRNNQDLAQKIAQEEEKEEGEEENVSLLQIVLNSN